MGHAGKHKQQLLRLAAGDKREDLVVYYWPIPGQARGEDKEDRLPVHDEAQEPQEEEQHGDVTKDGEESHRIEACAPRAVR